MTAHEHTPHREEGTSAGTSARTARTRSMPADAEVVFDVVTDLEHLADWLPPGVEIELYGPGLLRLWSRHAFDEPCERQVRIDWENLKVEWGSDEAPSHAGSLRVLRMTPGRSVVAVDLAGPLGLPMPLLDGWLAHALDSLAAVVGAEQPNVPWPVGATRGRRPAHDLAVPASA
ncbi:hypothetical protein ACRAKI_16140 [Saccharothrix isguenensis]